MLPIYEFLQPKTMNLAAHYSATDKIGLKYLVIEIIRKLCHVGGFWKPSSNAWDDNFFIGWRGKSSIRLFHFHLILLIRKKELKRLTRIKAIYMKKMLSQKHIVSQPRQFIQVSITCMSLEIKYYTFDWLLQEIDYYCFQDIFNTFYIIFWPIALKAIQKQISKKFWANWDRHYVYFYRQKFVSSKMIFCRGF